MTGAERVLYHQIHPLKLLTDVTTSFLSSSLLWDGRWGLAAGVALLPSVVVSGLLLWCSDLDGLARSTLGRYVGSFMTRQVEGIRLLGQLVMWAGAAAHVPWLLPLGFMIVVYGWIKGLWRPAP